MLGTKTHTYKKTRILWSFLAAVLTIQTLFMPMQASAAGAVDSMNLTDRVNSYTYYYAWAKCLDNSDKWDNYVGGGHIWISTDDAVAGKWFSTATGAGEEDGHVGYLASSGNGIMDCNGTDIVNKALSTWNLGSNKLSLLTTAVPNGFGFTKDDQGRYQPSSDYRSSFLKTIRNKVFGNQTPSLDGAAKYQFYAQSFIKACKASALSNPSPDQKSAADAGNSNKFARIATSKAANGSIVFTYYSLGGDTTMTDTFDVVEGHSEVGNVLGGAYSDGTVQCRTLVNDANKNFSAFATYIAENPDDRTADGLDSAASNVSVSSCEIDSVGWIVCPVMNFMAKVVDQAYNVIEGLLQVQPLYTTGGSSDAKSLYDAWSVMRNIANVLFVLAFMVVIYSQITGMGISNYGIKRLLPKIVIAAVLVNVSYWICVIAVDLSNIVGVGARSVLNAPFNSEGVFGEVSGVDGGGGWESIVGATLAGSIATGALLYATLSALLPALVAALLAIVTVFLVLTLRQALIILLVVIAPLAFVAFLLPNTEQWFKKWRGLFVTLLLMYPIIAFLFGASALASKIVMASSDSIPVQIMGALIAIIPLAITPIVLKTAGGVLNRFAGIVNNPNKGPFDRMRKSAEGYRDKRQNIAQTRRLRGTSAFGSIGRGLRGSNSRWKRAAGYAAGAGVVGSSALAGRKLTKDKQAQSAESAKKFAQDKYVAERAADESTGYAQKIAGPTGDAALAEAYAVQTLKKAKKEDYEAEHTRIDSVKNMGELMSMVANSNLSEERRAAALSKIYETGGDQHIHEALNYVAQARAVARRNNDTEAVEKLSNMQEFSGEALARRKPAGMGGTELSAYMQGQYEGRGSYEDSLYYRITAGKFGEKEWASMGYDDLIRSAKVLHEKAGRGELSQEQFNEINTGITNALSNENIQTTPEQKRVYDAILALQPPGPRDRLQNMDLSDPNDMLRVQVQNPDNPSQTIPRP